MKIANSKFCYLDPPFPETGLIAVAYIVVKQKKVLTILDRLCQTTQEITAVATQLESALAKEKIGFDGMVIYRVKKNQIISLEKQLWTECPATVEVNEQAHQFWYKQRQLIKWFETPLLMHMLVVPQTYATKSDQWVFCPIMPFYILKDNQQLHSFMKTSNDYVDIRAKSSATYIPVKAMSVRWATKNWKKVDLQTISQGSDILN